jgi:hypothetical protein
MALNDGMSAVLKKITRSLDTTISAFEEMQKASGKSMDTKLLKSAHTMLAQCNDEIDQMADEYERAQKQQQRLNDSIDKGTASAGGLLKKIAGIAGAYMSLSAVKGLVTDSMGLADTQIGVQTQLKTVTRNMGTGDYYDQILQKASDIQGRGMYGDEAMIAGAGELATYFTDGDAILSMMDTLTNYAAGMSGGGEVDSKAMTDYATGLGKIMVGSFDAMAQKGFEFTDVQKKIIEGTATEKQIAEELGDEYVNLSNDMQAAAVIGSVIDEGWSGLYDAMSQTPEGQIIQFKNTLGDLKETIGAGLYPAVLNFMSLFQENLPQIQEFADLFVQGIGRIINFLTQAANKALEFASTVQDNWSIIEPIVLGIVAALTAYAIISGIVAAVNGAHALSEGVKAAAQMMATGATLAETAAQHGLNAALLACPITWIVVGVIALVAAIAAVCSWIAKTTGIAATGFGVITGGINVAIQAVWNAMLVVANVAIGIWNALSACCSNIGTAFHNVIANVQGWFYGLLSTVLTVVSGICAALNKLPFVSFDYSGITAAAEEYAGKSAEAYGSVEEYTNVGDAFKSGMGTFDTFKDGWASDAFAAGSAWGDGVADKVSGLFDYEAGTIDDFVTDTGYAMDGIGSDTADIADSTGGMAKSLDVSNEQLQYLRDIAERDAINRFTTAEVKIDMTGMNNRIEGSADLDGVISQLTDGFAEALVTAAEGVHA